MKSLLRTQRGLKGAAVVFCRDGQGGSLSWRQRAADGPFRPRLYALRVLPGLPGWLALVVACWRWRADGLSYLDPPWGDIFNTVPGLRASLKDWHASGFSTACSRPHC